MSCAACEEEAGSQDMDICSILLLFLKMSAIFRDNLLNEICFVQRARKRLAAKFSRRIHPMPNPLSNQNLDKNQVRSCPTAMHAR